MTKKQKQHKTAVASQNGANTETIRRGKKYTTLRRDVVYLLPDSVEFPFDCPLCGLENETNAVFSFTLNGADVCDRCARLRGFTVPKEEWVEFLLALEQGLEAINTNPPPKERFIHETT
jgi:hypothetical protein